MSTVFSPDDKYIALSSWDQSLKLWNASSGEQLHDFGPTGGQNLKAPFSPDGKYVLATAAGLGLNPKVKNLVCDDPNADHSTITPFPGWVRTVAWSPDKEYLAACSWHGKIIVFQPSKNKVVQTWLVKGKTETDVSDLTWLDGGKKLAYRPGDGRLENMTLSRI